ncbi:MAG: DUF2746 domain-containing protein [Actinobacteria bacterium]|nr:DUF2746 domain-containing protein [Actinomycetota bacterium]
MEVLPDIGTVVPSVGVFSLLGWLIVHFQRQSSTNLDDYRARIVEQRREYREEIDELVRRHTEQIHDLRAQIVELRTEVKELRGEVDVERRARYQAEEDAANLRRRIRLDGGDG